MMTEKTALQLITDRECANILNIPLIENLKSFDKYLNAEDMLNLPADSPFGNLTLSFCDIISRFDSVNSLIIELYRDFDILKKQRIGGNGFLDSFIANRQSFLTEQIIYWFRKTADELISLICILKEFDQNKIYPKKIKVDSIGSCLHTEYLKSEIGEFRNYLKTLNDISNGYKHSLTNSQIHLHHGKDYPVVFAYILPFNDRTKEAKFHTHELKQIIEKYSMFLESCKNLLSRYSEKIRNSQLT